MVASGCDAGWPAAVPSDCFWGVIGVGHHTAGRDHMALCASSSLVTPAFRVQGFGSVLDKQVHLHSEIVTGGLLY